MSFEIWMIYLATVLAFMVTPGPSHLLMLSNSMVHGFRPALSTAAGDLSANALQMLAAGLGLSAILFASKDALTLVKWAGVAYLIWMGLRMWRQAGSETKPSAATSKRALWWQGFITSAANPKAVVFFAALFPQFITPEAPLVPQLLILSVTYIAIDGAFLASYGAGAGWLSSRLRDRGAALIQRIGATFLIGAALLLGLKTLRETG